MVKIKVLDLFAGCGGITTGLLNSGMEILVSIDNNINCFESLKHNFNHIVLNKDLTTYSPENLNKDYPDLKFDLVTAGFPCQGFSLAGRRDIKDKRNELYNETIKYINFYKPKSILIENVIGILSMKNYKNEKIIDIIINELNKNYDVKIFKLNSCYFNVPQKRRRIIIIGFRKDLNIIHNDIENISDIISVKTILERKEDIDIKYFLSKKAINGINKRKEKMKEKKYGFGAQFLDLEKPSYTISARYYKDGYDALVKYNEDEIRRLTILELKRIQTFNDEYFLFGSKKDKIIQIGNAVPVNLAFHIGNYIIKKLNLSESS